MKIKFRIALLFTAVVMAILLLVCISVYYLSFLNRENNFRDRLVKRALTAARLLIVVDEVDRALLKKIDSATIISLQKKSVIIYDSSYKEIYHYQDSNTIAVQATPAIFAGTKKGKYIFFHAGEKDVIAISYSYKGGKYYKAGDYFIVSAARDADGFHRLAQLKLVLIICFFLGSVATLVSGLLFSGRIVSHIKLLTNEVKIISSQNLSRRIELSGPKDELYALTATFNELLNRLQESFEIQRHFVANASHELSTPLTSITSQLEIALQQTRTKEEYGDTMQSVYEDVKVLNQLTRSLLELAKASGTPDGFELQLIRIDEKLMRLPPELKKTNGLYKVELTFETFPDDEDKLLVFGNKDLLYSAIKNIVLNACKYSSDHMALVHLSFDEKNLHIEVADHGIGISDHDKQKIFQPFFRSVENSNINGFGLGLPLSDKIIKLHKGWINVSDNKNVGTVFTITLPYGKYFHFLQ